MGIEGDPAIDGPRSDRFDSERAFAADMDSYAFSREYDSEARTRIGESGDGNEQLRRVNDGRDSEWGNKAKRLYKKRAIDLVADRLELSGPVRNELQFALDRLDTQQVGLTIEKTVLATAWVVVQRERRNSSDYSQFIDFDMRNDNDNLFNLMMNATGLTNSELRSAARNIRPQI